MKKKTLNPLCLIVSALVIITMLVGCTTGTVQTPADTKGTGSNTTTQAGNTTEADDSGVAKDGFPIVKEKITLNFLAPQGPGFKEFGEMETFQKYEEMTNIHIEWTMVPTSAMQEKKNLSLATGDFPDAYFGMKLTASDESIYGSQGVLLPIEVYLDGGYMPNLKKLTEKYPAIRAEITSPDSHIYALPEINFRLRDMVWGRLFINKKWVDALGDKMPTNTDELYALLKRFKTEDPNGNGKPDEIPLNSLLDYGSWGLSKSEGRYTDIVDGKLRFIAIDPMFKSYLEYHAKLYAEGLLDQEVFSQKKPEITAKGTQGLIGSSIWTAPDIYVGTELWRDYELVNPPLKGPEGHQIVNAAGADGVRNVKGTFAITSKNKYPEATARWVDWLYSVDGDRLFLSGIEGKHYENNSDGTWTLLVPEGMTRQQFMGTYTFTQGGSNFPRIFTADDWGLKEKTSDVGSVANNAAAAYKDYVPKEILPNLNYTEEEQKRLNALQADIITYVTQMEAKFIMNAEPFSNWDNYVNTIKNMGVDELMEIHQKAYDRYKASRK